MECKTMAFTKRSLAHHRNRPTPQPLQLALGLVNHAVEVSGGRPAYSHNVTSLNTYSALPVGSPSNQIVLLDQ